MLDKNMAKKTQESLRESQREFLIRKMSFSAVSQPNRFLFSVQTRPASLKTLSLSTELGGALKYFNTTGMRAQGKKYCWSSEDFFKCQVIDFSILTHILPNFLKLKSFLSFKIKEKEIFPFSLNSENIRKNKR